ncbi:MAG: DUF1854 domain-containing protein [Leptothrix sp. (in: b-proteobacteria)]
MTHAALYPMPASAFTLSRDAHGHLNCTDASGELHTQVVPVRAFPIEAPDSGVSLISSDGHELVWIAELQALEHTQRELIRAELAQREFMPVIQRLVSVSTFATPSTWEVETDRGATTFVLKVEEDIRRLANGALLIASAHGVHFHIRDRRALDRASRRLLERFL